MKFTNQHEAIKQIAKRYWHILTMDPVIGPYVSKDPSFAFKRARSLRDHLVSSDLKRSGKSCLCKYCKYCRFMNTARDLVLPNRDKYLPKHYANCQTTAVIQHFWQRAYRHILSMKACNPDLPLGRHVTNFHNGLPPKISFLILDRVHTSRRGGDINKLLLQQEQRWIFHQNATQPPGLNGSISYRPFLEGSASGGSEWDPP